ncbi:hypothetical protein B0H14DRAFT_2567231 [Mycena olivaceomarginata]|nr:hypothetical protein B0H14DRAFT_2567231 [Mycena olivaceomarginata]
MTPAPSRLMPPMPSTPCPNRVGDMRWLMGLILGSGGPGYPRISPITGRYVGASGDMSHSSHLLLTAMSPKLRTHAPTLDDILMEEDASDNAEGTPSWSQYIDDQAQDDTDSEMYDSGEDDDDEGMEAQVRREEADFFARENLAEAHEQWLRTGGPRPRIPTPPPLRGFARSPTPSAQDIRLIPPAQDMDVDEEEEEEEETLLGSSNSELASELFPPDNDSDPEEEQQHLPPPSSLTQVAARIRDHVSKYLDDQAEDSDEEAEEEHEGDEQEMKEDRDFVDDTAVHDDFVHRLPSNKDDAGEVQKWVAHFQNADKIALYERDVAREAAGEAGTPREMLSPRELALYNRAKHLRTGLQISKFERQRHLEMLENVDVKVHTWVRAPKAFDCRVGFVLAVTDLAVIQDGRFDPTFAHIALFVGSPLSGLEQHTLAKPSPALDAGDRVVVVTGESQGSVGTIEQPNERVSMARVITPDNKTIDVGLAQLKRHGLDLYYNFRIHDRVRVVSGGLYVGATGRVEQIDGCFLTIAVPNNSEVVGATLPSTMSNGNKIFIISIVHVTRQWAIGDSVRITRGEHENRRGVIFHLHQDGFLQLYDTNTTFSDEQLHSFKVRCSDVDFDDRWTDMATKLPFAGWSQGTATTDQPVSSALPFSSPDKSQRGFQGIEVMVAKPADFIIPSRETKGYTDAGTQGFIVIPHKGFIGIIIGDFDSQERSDRLKKAALDSLAQAEEVNHGKQPHHKSQSRTGKLLKPEEPTYTRLRDPDIAGIMVTIRGDHSLETVRVPIEHVRHLRQVSFDLDMFFSPILRTMRPLEEARFFPYDILYGTRELEPPSNPRAVTYRGPFRSDTEKEPAPPRSTTPTPANAAVWASQWQPPLEGEDTGLWLCLPELAFKRLDVQVIGIATLKLKKTSAAVRNCEGRKGWVLPTSAIPRDAKKVDVCSIGKNGTMHPIDKSCVKPLRTDDEGHPLGETAQRVVVIGPDAEGSSSRLGEYAQVVPLALHDYPSINAANNGRDIQSARTRAVRTNDNKSRSRPWSGFVAASTAPRPPSTSAHDWIDDYETKAASLSAEVSEAKAVAEGDPTNAAKSTAADYTERFGPSEPDADVSSYIARRTRREYQMDELRHRAISDSCPFTNPGPLDAYYEAAAAFDRDFGHKYEATDEYEDRLSTKRKLRDIYKKILDLPEDRRTRLVGQRAFSTSLQNPFPEHDLRRVTFDNKLRDRVAFYTRSTADSFAPTLHRTTIHLVFRNPWYAEPLSIKCIRQYCKHTMWFEELEAMEAEAQREARRRAPPSPIPTRTFYGAVDTALH